MTKNEIRERALAIRKNVLRRAQKDKRIEDAAVAFAAPYDRILLYAALPNEAPTLGIYRRLQEKVLFVPFTDATHRMHAVRPLPSADFSSPDRYGNLPKEEGYCDGQADLIFVPLVAFNANLYRIGYGKGCYDRYFATHTSGIKVGLAYEEQFAAFAHDDTDVPLDYIITPNGIRKRTT